jgi:hypothetical protein
VFTCSFRAEWHWKEHQAGQAYLSWLTSDHNWASLRAKDYTSFRVVEWQTTRDINPIRMHSLRMWMVSAVVRS